METFDTLAAARRLQTGGFSQEQAEAVAEELLSASRADYENLTTKADLTALKSDLKSDIAVLEARVTWRMVALAGLVIAAVKLIPDL